jgi:Tfp pilus assembly protein PilO
MSRRGPIIVAIVGVLLVALTVAGLILPKLNDIRATQQKTAVAVQQQQKLEVTLSALQSLRKALQRYGIEVPPTADLSGLIRDLTGAAGQSAVTLESIAPAAPLSASSPAVSIIPLQVTVNGGYFAVDEFLYRLERMARVSTVTAVSITPGTSVTTTASSSDSSSTYPLTAPSLTAVTTANFFTTDVSSGPGSKPGSQEQPAPGTGSGSTGGAGTTGGSGSTTSTT